MMRISLYMKKETMEAIENRKVKNVSQFINTSISRYLLMAEANVPDLTVEEYTDIFEVMMGYEFGRLTAAYEAAALASIMKERGMDEDIVVKVMQLTIPQRVALIDCIERSQIENM